MIQFVNTQLPDIIELKNIRQTYDGGKTFIVDHFNLLIEDKPEQGQFVVILGASGCGKSTILRFICGLQEPTEGEVLIGGKPRNDDEHRISMVFQKYSSLPWMTVLDNVGLGLEFQGVSAKERKEKSMEMIKLVGLEGHENKFAKYPTLSGGQLQRVAIARSLIANPNILLMDEPFGALDINTRLKMQDMLAEIWHQFHPTIIFVTHDIAEAVYLGDDIFMMRANPGYISNHIHVNLPPIRKREMKRDPDFIKMVYEVEDIMVSLEQTAKKKE